MKKLLLILSAALVYINCEAQTILNVGPGQTYLTITQAYAAIPATITGAYEIRLMSGYNSASETFPLSLAYRTGASSINTIKIIPQVANLQITSSNADATVKILGSYITIDGRIGGTGDTANFKIINSNVAGNAIEINYSGGQYPSGNTVKYCNVSGMNTNTSEGVIYYISRGSNNLITKCVIHSLGNNLPANLIRTSITTPSSGNSIIDNYFFDYSSKAILINTDTDWLVSGNHIYAGSVSNSLGTAISVSIYDEDTATVTGNYIGGSQPYCLGSPSGTTTSGIGIAGPANSYAIVRNNHIKNIYSENYFTGISVSTDNSEISDNIIGDTAINYSIRVYVNTNYNSVINGIKTQSGGVIDNNTIGGINFYAENIDVDTLTLYAINTGGTTCSNNRIGSINTPDNILLGDSISSGVLSQRYNFYGINNYGTYGVSENNVISNITMTKGNSFYGIKGTKVFDNLITNISNPVYYNQYFCNMTGIEARDSVMNNTVMNLNSSVTYPYTTNMSVGKIIGIMKDVTYNDTVQIRNNLLKNFNSSDKSTVYGIYVPTTLSTNDDIIKCNATIEDNTILNFSNAQPPYSLIGIWYIRGVVRNNLVRNFNSRGSCTGIYNYISSGFNSGNIGKSVIENNIIDSLYTKGDGISGIYSHRGTIKNNTISRLYADSSSINDLDPIRGIYVYLHQAYEDSIIVYNNVISKLYSRALNAPTTITGIHIAVQASPLGATLWVRNNSVMNIGANPLTVGDSIIGIKTYRYNGYTNNEMNLYNNLIRLGIDETGNTISSDATLLGIMTSGYDYQGNYNYNTVYIGGSNPGSSNSMAFSGQPTNFYNNLLCNKRTTSGSGKNYAFWIRNTNHTADNCLLFSNGNGGILASVDGGVTPLNSISALQNADAGQHSYSISGDPLLDTPEGNEATVNLSPTGISPALAAGVYLPSILVDYYYFTRGFTPTIGAIENNINVGIGNSEETFFGIYPNPATEQINFNFTEPTPAQTFITISNTLGQVIKTERLPAGLSNYTVNVSGLAPGMYIVKTENSAGGSSAKIIKQ